jgi:hypothetical protein
MSDLSLITLTDYIEEIEAKSQQEHDTPPNTDEDETTTKPHRDTKVARQILKGGVGDICLRDIMTAHTQKGILYMLLQMRIFYLNNFYILLSSPYSSIQCGYREWHI